MSDILPRWYRADCEVCGSTYCVTRTEPKPRPERLMCEDCSTYERVWDEATKAAHIDHVFLVYREVPEESCSVVSVNRTEDGATKAIVKEACRGAWKKDSINPPGSIEHWSRLDGNEYMFTIKRVLGE